ncbi:MAG: hypothetical protein JNL01_12105 [Bdellovibrionales bacterium]|nr:hypothetical protein [Bdellovibrionales bacterium]
MSAPASPPLVPPLGEDSLWMVRTVSNRLSGPMPQKDLKVKILSHEIGLQDEICPSQGYWFFLHERMEVERWLKMDVPKPKPPAGSLDVTQGGGWAAEEETATDTEMPRRPAAPTAPAQAPQVTPQVEASKASSVTVRSMPEASKEPSERAKKIRWFLKEFGFVVVIAISILIFAGFRLARLN